MVSELEKGQLKSQLIGFGGRIPDRIWKDIVGVDISTVGQVNRGADEGDKHKTCFVVYLKRWPRSYRRPEEYMGTRVCWVVGIPKK